MPSSPSFLIVLTLLLVFLWGGGAQGLAMLEPKKFDDFASRKGVKGDQLN